MLERAKRMTMRRERLMRRVIHGRVVHRSVQLGTIDSGLRRERDRGKHGNEGGSGQA